MHTVFTYLRCSSTSRVPCFWYIKGCVSYRIKIMMKYFADFQKYTLFLLKIVLISKSKFFFQWEYYHVQCNTYLLIGSNLFLNTNKCVWMLYGFNDEECYLKKYLQPTCSVPLPFIFLAFKMKNIFVFIFALQFKYSLITAIMKSVSFFLLFFFPIFVLFFFCFALVYI